jgi:hypothetical protein
LTNAALTGVDYNATEMLSCGMKDLLLESVYDPGIIV